MVDLKANVGNDQEKAQSERDSNSKIRGVKNLDLKPGTYISSMTTYRKPSEQLLPNSGALSNLNLTKI